MKGITWIPLHTERKPRVLLLGNGLLRLANGPNWNELLRSLRTREVNDEVLQQIPSPMRPEVLYGSDIEKLRTHAVAELETYKPALSAQLERLLALDFDCILTTNYTYEIENILLGRPFTAEMRRSTLRTFGESKRYFNLQVCYELQRNGKPVQVWHIHGDAMRKDSLVMSYHSYAKGLSSLWQYSSQLADTYHEHQAAGQALPVHSWLEWLLAGELYSVGFGWDFAELDLWWGMERCAREHGEVGQKRVYFFSQDRPAAQAALLESFGAKVTTVQNDVYDEAAYDRLIDQVRRDMER